VSTGHGLGSNRRSVRDGPATAVRIAIVDDHRLLTAALAVALRAERCEAVVPSVSTLPALLDMLLDARPSVVLLDRNLGTIESGEALIAPLSEAGIAVIVLSAALDEVAAGRCLAQGAVACISKTEPFDALLTTVLRVARGDRPISVFERTRLVETWRRWKSAADAARAPFASLTAREACVLGELMEGRSVRSIAADSCVSEGTVRTQIHSILTKLGVGKQLEAVAMAVRTRWAPPMTPMSPEP
jgi:two-component system, NarL family, nitrate/nitrite response regulator NarL